MAEHGTPDLISSQAPFIQALVQKSVTAITKLAGRLSFRMLRHSKRLCKSLSAKSWNHGCRIRIANLSHVYERFITETQKPGKQKLEVRMQNQALNFCILTSAF